MLSALVILGLALAAVGLVLFVALCVAIQREDRSALVLTATHGRDCRHPAHRGSQCPPRRSARRGQPV